MKIEYKGIIEFLDNALDHLEVEVMCAGEVQPDIDGAAVSWGENVVLLYQASETSGDPQDTHYLTDFVAAGTGEPHTEGHKTLGDAVAAVIRHYLNNTTKDIFGEYPQAGIPADPDLFARLATSLSKFGWGAPGTADGEQVPFARVCGVLPVVCYVTKTVLYCTEEEYQVAVYNMETGQQCNGGGVIPDDEFSSYAAACHWASTVCNKVQAGTLVLDQTCWLDSVKSLEKMAEKEKMEKVLQ